MNWKNYKKDVDYIQYSQTNQQAWIIAMQQEEMQRCDDKQRKRGRIPVYVFVLSIVFLIIAITNPMYVVDSSPLNMKMIDSAVFHQPIQDNLPLIRVGLTSGGMGFPSFILANHHDVDNGNPWLEEFSIESLPVYKNGIQVGPRNEVLQGGHSDQALQELIEMYEKRLSFSDHINEVAIDSNLERSYKEGIIFIHRNGSINIQIYKDKYPIKQTLHATTREEAQQYSLALAQELNNVLDLENPAPNVSVHYNIDNEACWNYGVYDKQIDSFDDMYAYSMKQIQFSANDNDVYISINSYLVGEKMGDYPIISLKDARQRFIEGKYLSLCPSPASEMDIAKIELIYYRTDMSAYIVPMYLIYAAIDPAYVIDNEGFQTFGTYYVPVIDSQYIEFEDVSYHKFN